MCPATTERHGTGRPRVGSAAVALVLLASSGCRDKTAGRDCEKLQPFLVAGPTSACAPDDAPEGSYKPPREHRRKPDEIVQELDGQIAQLRALDLKTRAAARDRDELVRHHRVERDLCIRYTATTPEERRTLGTALHEAARSRRGFVEGAGYRCSQIMHPPHFP